MQCTWITSSLSRNAGGLYYSVRRLAQSVKRLTGHGNVLGLVDENTDPDIGSWAPLEPRAFRIHGPRTFGYAPLLTKALRDLDPEILSLHGLWMYPSVAALRWHTRTKRPFLVSPHGMLDSWALKQYGWKKRLASALYQHKALSRAGCVRALCRSEADSILKYGCRNPICIIPNGVDLPPSIADRRPKWASQLPDARRVLLFLGRLHPKKNLLNLLKAWAASRNSHFEIAKDWCLAIAGWNQSNYEQQLRFLAAELRVEDSVHFIGPQFGEEKHQTYCFADAAILPSFSEGLPIAALEAWSYGLPLLMTPACNLPEAYTTGGAIRIEPETESIQNGLRLLFEMSVEQRAEIGNFGRQLVERQFTWERVAQEILAVCDWLLGRGQAPGSVVQTA